ncbi:MAG: hypothetical protein KTR31_32080 [Myxococcales bacterium]|nr:hypothetical protein [Myxococcales bacterium]
MAALIVIVVTTGAVANLDPWLAVAGAAMLVMATGEVLLPTRYELSTEGVAVLGTFSRRRQDWSRVAGWRAVPEGFVLVGQGSRPVLRRRRTLTLRCAEDRGSVARHLARHVAELPSEDPS